ncbi:MAG TPA: thiamine phosphate synthase [Kiritimatiellia bacterium]|nr:thiamine phosphate synthase [Kiritimatiellia bacterium]HRU70594.1 thiamine phosphate synthase [Kiritimatiellia bacterium]
MMQTSKIEMQGLYLVLTDPVTGYARCAEAAVACGVRWLQLRMKRAAREEIVAVGLTLRAITRGTATRLVVNDDVEVAREVDADGVHLGQNDMPLDEARRRWPEAGKIFGLSTHNRGQAADAVACAPDYIGVGPVFATPTKAIPDPVLGLEEMGAIIRASPVPTVAIGGIGPENLAGVRRHGATAFAVVRAVNRATDPETAIRRLQAVWQEAHLIQPPPNTSSPS